VQTAAEQLRWGDPLDEQTDIGPVISHLKREEHDALVAQAESELGKEQVIRLFPQLMADERQVAGTYARPVIIRADDPGHPVVQEETMSPMLVVQPADDFDHALALCNGVRHGLAAALFCQRKELRSRFLAGARAGIVKFDTSTAGVDVRLPFGGCKASSVGPPEHGEADVQFHTRWQAVYGWDDR
jgi:aldehyde dehydrogenase (NAD+)